MPQRKQPETEFTPTAPRRSASPPPPHGVEGADAQRGAGAATLVGDKHPSNRGIWIGLGVGKGVPSFSLTTFVLLLESSGRSSGSRSQRRSRRKTLREIAAADLKAMVPPIPFRSPRSNRRSRPSRPPTVQVPLVPLTPVAPPTPVASLPAAIDAANIRRVKKATTFLQATASGGVQVEQGRASSRSSQASCFTNAHVVHACSIPSSTPSQRAVDIVLNSGEPDRGRCCKARSSASAAIATMRFSRLPARPATGREMLACRFRRQSSRELQDVYVLRLPVRSQPRRQAHHGQQVLRFRPGLPSRTTPGSLHEDCRSTAARTPATPAAPSSIARGVVVAVAVAIIRGTQINFAVPAEGASSSWPSAGLLGSRIQDPYLAGDAIRLPFEVTCLDPLQRVRKVEVEVWIRPSGIGARPAERSRRSPSQGGGATYSGWR